MFLMKEALQAQEQTILLSYKMCWKGRRPLWMNRELFLRFQEKKRAHASYGRRDKQRWRSTRKLIGYGGKKIRKVKAQHELNLATVAKDNKKCFYKYINSKRKTKEYLHHLLEVTGNMITEG